MSVLQNSYPCKGWSVPVNNWRAWSDYRGYGFYTPANDNEAANV